METDKSDLSVVMDFLARQEDLHHGLGATPAQIDELEKMWGHRLPEDYRAFVEKYGWAQYGSTDIAGLGDGIPMYLDIGNLAPTLWTGPVPMSKDLLPFDDSGGGWFYCFMAEPSRVVDWDPMYGQNQPFDETYESWSQWFRATLIDPLDD